MKEIKVQDAVGHALVHDIVRIVIGEVKDTPFRRGHVITKQMYLNYSILVKNIFM